MDRVALAVMVELSGFAAQDDILALLGILEEQPTAVPHRRPRSLPSKAFREERRDAWAFAHSVAASFGMYGQPGDNLQDWMLHSLEYASLVTYWNTKVVN